MRASSPPALLGPDLGPDDQDEEEYHLAMEAAGSAARPAPAAPRAEATGSEEEESSEDEEALVEMPDGPPPAPPQVKTQAKASPMPFERLKENPEFVSALLFACAFLIVLGADVGLVRQANGLRVACSALTDLFPTNQPHIHTQSRRGR